MTARAAARRERLRRPRSHRTWLPIASFFAAALAWGPPARAEERPPEGPDPAQCADQADNDQDGKVDCADEGCTASTACGTGLSPELRSKIGGLIGAKGTQLGTARESAAEPIILGDLDKSLIDTVIKRNLSRIRYCYQRALTEDPELHGTVLVKFVIAKDGSVSSATTKSSTLGNAAVEECINGMVARFQFPEPKGGGIVIVTYPFAFTPG